MRKFKIFGLSALAALAVSAVSVSAASAAEGTFVVTGSGAFTATQTGAGEALALPGGRVLSCTTMTFTGTVANGSKTLTGTPTWAGCHVTVGVTTLSATVAFTACDLSFSDLTTTAANTYAAKAAIVCPAGQAIHISIYTNTSSHNGSTLLCEYTSSPQTGLTGVHVTDNANNTLNTEWTEVGLGITKTLGTVGNCGGATSTSKLSGGTLLTPAAGTTIDIDD